MSSRMKLALMMALFAVPTLASFAVFYFFPPTKTNNYGELISPVVNLPQIPLRITDGADAATAAEIQGLRGKWLIVTRDSGACDVACEQKIFTMRQSRLIVGREMDRVVRVVLIDDDIAPAEALLKRYQGTAWVTANASAWLSKLPTPTEDNSKGRAYIYAVDPLGNLFMRYAADADTKLIAKDLRQVLKASQIG